MNSNLMSSYIVGNSQAIHLPKAFAYPKNTPLMITKEKDTVTLKPVKNLAQVPELFAQIGKNTANFDEKIEREFIDRK